MAVGVKNGLLTPERLATIPFIRKIEGERHRCQYHEIFGLYPPVEHADNDGDCHENEDDF